MGEIVVRGDAVMEGYWKQPEATRAAMEGGWLHTGDIATIDANSYLRVVDRKKDIIVSGGENISSLEIEKALVSHPAIYEAVVIPVPDEKWGEAPKGLVVLRPGPRPRKPNSCSSAARCCPTISARTRSHSSKACRRREPARS